MKSFLYATALWFLASMAASAEPVMQVHDAWVREAPPGARMLAAYMTITNPSDEDRLLMDVSSPRFTHVMMHRSEVIDGMARMIHQDSIRIPAHGDARLEPGSYHLMMPSPDKPLKSGDPVVFVLHFSNGDQLEVQAEVRKP